MPAIGRAASPGRAAKRGLDLVLASCALIAAAPLLLIIAAAIRLTMGSPVIFRQERPGLHEQPFTILKFRSMAHPKASEDEFADQAGRVTRLGHWLRLTSLDELPELWNVVRGEMSLVGPRPLLMQYLSSYSADQRRRHDVKPGITGLAQVNGRQTLAWDERFKMDVRYVDHWSLRLDAQIMLDTIHVLLQGQATLDPSEEGFWFAGPREEVE